MRRFYASLLLLFLCSSFMLHGQGTEVEFGKNRVQYHKDFEDWSFYESQNFVTYWYGEGRRVGQLSVQLAELDFLEIVSLLEHRINEKTEIIVYTDVSDIKQSNIGTEDTFINSGGQTKIVGNKIFVFFDGNHLNLRRQIREGIATVYLNSMLFGSNIQEIVQNAVLLNLPLWFKDGLISFAGEEWNSEIDVQLRNLLQDEYYQDFEKLTEDYPVIAGHAMWYFISQNYGRSTVSNLLYLTRINRSIDAGLLYVLGTSYDKMVDNWKVFFSNRYKQDVQQLTIENREALAIKNRRNAKISNFKISPDGSKLAYVQNEIGKTKIFIQDLKTGERKKILKNGFRNPFQETDYGYPLLAWNPNNQQLGIIYEKRDVPYYLSYDLATEEEVVEPLDPQIQRVYSMDFINPGKILFSAANRGIGDLFIYRPSVRQTERITNDFWDDLDAVVVNLRGKKGIVFASNRVDTLLTTQRPDSILPINTYDLFYYDLDNRPGALVRLTNTPLANERSPHAIDSLYFGYRSDVSGVYNRYAGYMDEIFHYNERVITFKDSSELVMHEDSSIAKIDSSTILSMRLREKDLTIGFVHPTTNFSNNISEIHTAYKKKFGYELFYENDEPNLYKFNVDPKIITKPWTTAFKKKEFIKFGLVPPNKIGSTGANETNQELTQSDSPKEDNEKVDPGLLFQSEFDDPLEREDLLTLPEKKIKVETDNSELLVRRPSSSGENLPAIGIPGEQFVGVRFNPSRIVPYRLKFRTDLLTTRMDNSLLFGGLDNFAATPQAGNQNAQQAGFSYPALGILLKASIKDLFEDYILEGGIRIPTTFNGAEYFVTFDNRKNRLDKRIALYRRNLRVDDPPTNNFVQRSRSEESTHLGQYQLRYPIDIFTSIRGISTIRFDKRTKLATDSIAFGVATTRSQRIGFRLEYVFDNTLDVMVNIKNGTRYKIFAEAVKKFSVDLTDNFNLSFNEGWMGVLGFDARHYQRLDKRSILALRLAGTTTFGAEKILYYLGGVDNWLFSRFDNTIPRPLEGDFAFETIATNLRGFNNNIRNGNSYALANVELRVPVLNYLIKRIQSPFLKNFQVVGFFDVGTAWEGPTPFDISNPINSTVVNPENTGIEVNVNYFRDPIVAGFGWGLRTTVFGYFIRFDWARGIETRQVRDRMLYFSLGKDF